MEAIQKEEADARAKIARSLAGLKEPNQKSQRSKELKSKRVELKNIVCNMNRDLEVSLES